MRKPNENKGEEHEKAHHYLARRAKDFAMEPGDSAENGLCRAPDTGNMTPIGWLIDAASCTMAVQFKKVLEGPYPMGDPEDPTKVKMVYALEAETVEKLNAMFSRMTAMSVRLGIAVARGKTQDWERQVSPINGTWEALLNSEPPPEEPIGAE